MASDGFVPDVRAQQKDTRNEPFNHLGQVAMPVNDGTTDATIASAQV